MPRYRLTKIVTRTGDAGTTSLGGGQRVPKDSARIEAYGTVDELNSCLGVAAAQKLDPELVAMVKVIQNGLFDLGADLCLREKDKRGRRAPEIEARHVQQLEAWLDQILKALKPLENFVIPGGAPGAAHLHVCRCVCRRAERCVLRLKRREAVGAHVIPYLNRLGDLLFVMARFENLKQGRAEELWDEA